MSLAYSPKLESANLIDAYQRVRAHTEALCEPLETEDFIPQPAAFASPPKWNVAHTTWFFEEMILKPFAPAYRVFDERFGFLFNSYYNTVGGRTARGERGDLSRPTVREVFAYRRRVDEQMRELLAGETAENVRALVILGLNHEQQHQELLLTDLKYTFSRNPLSPAYRENFAPCEIVERKSKEFIAVEAGNYEVGFTGEGFCFDNELGRHTVYLGDFAVAENLVTNGEWTEFVEAGGYRDFRLWHSDGWNWVNENGIDAPLYWQRRDGGEWWNFTLGGWRKTQPDAPVCHVSFYEAAAFAEWKNARLPTEFEWETAASRFDWGLRWEWTNSAYLPYPGFARAAGAVGEYNGKFMVNQMILRGASVATAPGHSRPTYRNFFQPDARWQFTGVRLAR